MPSQRMDLYEGGRNEKSTLIIMLLVILTHDGRYSYFYFIVQQGAEQGYRSWIQRE